MKAIADKTETAIDELELAERHIPDQLNKIERISGHTKGLFDELRSWVDLRVQLVQVEIEEKIDAKVNAITLQVALGICVFLIVVFALVTLALGLGAWLGHAGWGFGIVTALLILVTGVLRVFKPRFVQIKERDESKNEKTGD